MGARLVQVEVGKQCMEAAPVGKRELGEYLEGGVEWKRLLKMGEMTASLC